MKVRIQIDTQTFVRFWLVVIGFALAALAIYSARTGLIILGSALFLALALHIPVTKLARHLPGNSRVGSTAISYVLIVAVLGTFTFLAVPPIIQQTAKFAQTVPSLVDNATKSWRGLDSAIDQYNLRPQFDKTLNNLRDNASKYASNVGASVLTSLGSIASFITALFLTLVLSFLMLIEGPAWMERIWGIYRNQKLMERHRKIAHKLHSVVSGYVIGQLSVSGIGALSAGIMVVAISFFSEIPANLAIPTAAVTFILSLVPMFGATIAGIVVFTLLAFNAIGAGIAYVIFFIVYQQIENNFISPAIQSKRLDLSPLAVLASVTVGLYLFGIAGGIISIPIAGSIKVLLEDYLEHAREARKKDNKAMHKIVKKIADKQS